MVARAYVLVETQVGKTKGVVEAVRGLKGIVSADVVTGPYDAIATIEGKSLTELGELLTAKIHPIDGISRTVTCLVVESD